MQLSKEEFTCVIKQQAYLQEVNPHQYDPMLIVHALKLDPHRGHTHTYTLTHTWTHGYTDRKYQHHCCPDYVSSHLRLLRYPVAPHFTRNKTHLSEEQYYLKEWIICPLNVSVQLECVYFNKYFPWLHMKS